MKIHELKFPASLACAVVFLDVVSLRKWIGGHGIGASLKLDGELARRGDEQRRYTFTDVVRLDLLTLLRQTYGVDATRAVQMCNSAFNEIAAGVQTVLSAIDIADEFAPGDSDGPWLFLERPRRHDHASLIENRKQFFQAAQAGRFNCAVVFDLCLETQKVSAAFARPALAPEIKTLRARHQSEAERRIAEQKLAKRAFAPRGQR